MMPESGLSRGNTLAPGMALGKYDLLKRLAYGGMAEIWLARVRGIQGFEKHVVVKRILPQFSENEKFIRMFLNEARVAAGLDHPNIAQVHDIGQENGIYFFVMEYLHGENLGTVLKTLVSTSRRMPLEQSITIGVSAAAGLHFAHEKQGPDGRTLGLVHRDVSPSNLVVTYSGAVKLVDFGIAKVANATHDLSKTNTPKGKAAYMSPEQCRNERLDRRTDIFALGIVLHEITTMKRLFRAESELATLKLIEACQVPPPSALLPGYPPALERIVMKALRASPDDRYETALHLQRDLEQFARDHRLPISTAATAEFMEGLFGKKQEPWRAPELIAAPTPAVVLDGESRPRIAPKDPDAGQSLTRPMRVEPAPAEPERPVPRKLLIPLVATAVLALGAGAVAAYVLVTRDDPPAEPVLLIAETGNVSVGSPLAEPSPASRHVAKPDEPPPPPLEGAGAPGAGANSGDRGATSESPRTRERANEDKYSRAFSRQQSKIAACFQTHAATLTGAPEIAVRFQIATDGRPTSVDVLPAELASTRLGACIADVARKTEFGPQRAPVTFRIPLKVRLK